MCKLFQEYMRNNGISEGSVKKYSKQVACNADVREIIEKTTGKDSLYKVNSPEEAEKIERKLSRHLVILRSITCTLWDYPTTLNFLPT